MTKQCNVALGVGAGDAIGAAYARRRADAGGKNIEIAPDTLMNLDSIAAAYWALSQQSRDAWTFELDIRPFAEQW